MTKGKEKIKYLVLFLLFLLWNLIIQPIDYDEIYNYGFSVSLYQGLIPYKDFNMVIPPFFNFLLSLPFQLLGKNIFIFHLEGALLLTAISCFLFKLIHEKAWIIIALFFIGICDIYPTYNIFCYLLLLIVIFLEKEHKSDYLIGLIIGLCILSKQTIGFTMALVGILYYIKDKKKIGKRLIGMSIPCLIFLVYLLIFHTFDEFFNLCILGLFDFAKENTKPDIFNFVFLILVMISVLVIYKQRKVENYYCISYFIVAVPIMDRSHVNFLLMSFLLLILLNYPLKCDRWIKYISISLIISSCFLSIKDLTDFDIKNYPNKVKNFEYRYIKEDYLRYNEQMIEKIDQYGIKNIVIIAGSETYFLKLQKNEKLNYLDLVNNGNWGYHGDKKMLNEVKKNRDKVFFIEESQLIAPYTQVNKTIIKYIKKNAKLIDTSTDRYGIYKFNSNNKEGG